MLTHTHTHEEEYAVKSCAANREIYNSNDKRIYIGSKCEKSLYH